MSDEHIEIGTRRIDGQVFYKAVLPQLILPQPALLKVEQSLCDPVIASSMTALSPSFLSDGSFGVCYLYATLDHAVSAFMANIEPILMIGAGESTTIELCVTAFEINAEVLDCCSGGGEALFEWDTDTQTLGRNLFEEGAAGVLFPDQCDPNRAPVLCLFRGQVARRLENVGIVKALWGESGFEGYMIE